MKKYERIRNVISFLNFLFVYKLMHDYVFNEIWVFSFHYKLSFYYVVTLELILLCSHIRGTIIKNFHSFSVKSQNVMMKIL